MSRSSIPTVVISHQHPFINNFDVLPTVIHHDDLRIIRLYHDPTDVGLSYTNGFASNSIYDLLITDEVEKPVGYTDGVPRVSLPRLPKNEQAVKLMAAVRRVFPDNNCHFRAVKSYLLNDPSSLGEFDGLGRIVAKHEHGARGLGQVVINLDKIGFEKARSLLFKLKKSTGGEDVDAKIAKVLDEAGGAMYLSKGHEKYEGEYLDYLKDITLLQGCIENIIHEYRLITNLAGDIVWAQERELEGEGFRTATGSNGDTKYLHNPAMTLANEFPEVFKEVQAVLKEMKLGLNSIDLFITGAGEWGFFEFCNQWGIQGINAGWAKEYQKTALLDILKMHHFID